MVVGWFTSVVVADCAVLFLRPVNFSCLKSKTPFDFKPVATPWHVPPHVFPIASAIRVEPVSG